MPKENKFFDTLLPTHPDFQPIIQKLRDKYGLLEVLPDGEPITEIFLKDEPVAFEDFRKEVQTMVSKAPDHLPPEVSKILTQARVVVGKPLKVNELRLVPKKLRDSIIQFMKIVQDMAELTVKQIDEFDSSIADMLYIYLLTGETQETSADWFSKVIKGEIFGEPVVMAFASQMVDPEIVVQQFRKEYAKTFGGNRPKFTNKIVSTAYYMQLKRSGKSWDFIVEEYIKRNKFSMPRDRSSKRYLEIWNRHFQRIKKRMDRSEIILNVLLRDKK